MIKAPYETKSDTFFFVENKLIIHNRAEYNYAPLDGYDDEEGEEADWEMEDRVYWKETYIS